MPGPTKVASAGPVGMTCVLDARIASALLMLEIRQAAKVPLKRTHFLRARARGWR